MPESQANGFLKTLPTGVILKAEPDTRSLCMRSGATPRAQHLQFIQLSNLIVVDPLLLLLNLGPRDTACFF